ncbi:MULTISPECIES: hypothetical protein [unclassified Micromonospora]|uniref:hypothetical protein n=1 Tax=unclassified Micromonospora TaxID=2617518 RepID=UPI00332957DE
MTVVPRLVLSAPSSGHGKNALAIGLLAAFADRGVDAAGFKIGTDHVDAAYPGLAAGHPGRTLDPRLVGGADRIAHGASGAGLALVRGNMRLYDSLAGRPESESTAAVATWRGVHVPRLTVHRAAYPRLADRLVDAAVEAAADPATARPGGVPA